MRTSNPALNDSVFTAAGYEDASRTMTVSGTAMKAGVLLGLVTAAAGYTWQMAVTAGPQAAMPWMMGGGIGGLIFAMITIFKPAWSPVTAPIYAILEGLLLGAISALINTRYPGIAFQAVLMTFGTMFSLLVAYQTGLIRATENFKLGVVAATGGIALVYIVSMVLGFFGMTIPLIHEAGIVGIGFSLFVVLIAALNLVLDFDFIETGAARGAPKYMEWYGAFGLMVTLIWLYMEILRLLSKLRSRD